MEMGSQRHKGRRRVAAQQGIRFNIFQLNQTYTGEDERLNIGPKGFTGEKYGGTTYWDTEAFASHFIWQLPNKKLPETFWFTGTNICKKQLKTLQSLALPMVQPSIQWLQSMAKSVITSEITFEEIHRNGEIAFAIYDYIRYTGDWDYLAQYGFEVLLGISRLV